MGAAEVCQPKDEVEIDFLRRNHGIHEDENMFELTAVGDVFRDEGGEHVAALFRLAGIAIAREIDEVTDLGWNGEVVDEFGLSWAGGGFG